ncbi:MAG TPA: hypothetical protein VHM88_14445 [Candidatus Acidoferrales bacterium]|jgi:hypothetical protein|nr:hypothetical protein [Candidatus Acidoferrales bacterium]
MNRAFLIILFPAVLVAFLYIAAAHYLGVRLNTLWYLGAGAGVLVVIVYLYRRGKARPSGG